MKSKEQLRIPDPINGDTVMHMAFKKGNFEALMAMLEKGGNPFVKNKRGESIVSYLQASEPEIQQKFEPKIKELKIKALLASIKSEESPVHRSVRENNLKRLKRLRMFCATLESYNSMQEKPIDIAMKNGNLEIALYIMKYSQNVFDDSSRALKCFDFLSEKIASTIVDLTFIEDYTNIWKTFLEYGIEHRLNVTIKSLPEFGWIRNRLLQLTQLEENKVRKAELIEDEIEKIFF